MPHKRRCLNLFQLICICFGLAVTSISATWAYLPLNRNAQSGLQNGNFASDLSFWQQTTYGAKPAVRITRSSGVSFFSVSADSPSDTAFGQEITLTPGATYKLGGWIQTHDLDPRSARVYGAIQVQQSMGAGIIASGKNHSGTTSWTQDNVWFSAPDNGKVRICLFFVGFGKGIGQCQFRDIHLEQIDVSNATVKILRKPLHAAKISPYQYGQFIENLCDLVPAMWAEKLYDSDFEGLTPYTMAFIRETDNKEKPWYPDLQVNRATFKREKSDKTMGRTTYRISTIGTTSCQVGLSQDGISVHKSQPLNLKIWGDFQGNAGKLRVSLHHDAQVFASQEFKLNSDHFSSVRLVPNNTDTNTTFTLEFNGPGTLALSRISMMPEKNILGWRPDVFQALKELHPGIIRFGGSTLDDANLGAYEWKETIGPVINRKPFRAWGGLQPTGPGLEEIVQLIRAVGAEPLICIRYHAKTPKDAADEVEYFNGAVSTPMGALRARNGHPAPYHIKYWQVGNEIGEPQYARDLPSWCKAIRQVDSSVKLLSSFPSEQVVRNAASELEYLSPHQYTTDLAGMEAEIVDLQQMIKKDAGGKHLKLAITEWNTTAGDWGTGRATLWTLSNALACAKYHNMLHRHSDIVEIANRSNLTNSFCSGIIQTDNDRMYLTPTYYAQQLYAKYGAGIPLEIESRLPTNVGLDMSAVMSEDGNRLSFFVVNDTPKSMSRKIDFSAFRQGKLCYDEEILEDTQHFRQPDAVNSWTQPKRIRVTGRLSLSIGSEIQREFEPYTLTVISCPVNVKPKSGVAK